MLCVFSAFRDIATLSPQIVRPASWLQTFSVGRNVALLYPFYYKYTFHLFLYVFIFLMKVLYYRKMFTLYVVKLNPVFRAPCFMTYLEVTPPSILSNYCLFFSYSYSLIFNYLACLSLFWWIIWGNFFFSLNKG